MNRTIANASVGLALCAWMVAPLAAQNRSGFVLSGYGSATYAGSTGSDFRNDFSASVSPVLLYSRGSDFLFEAELEFGLHGEATTTMLEYAQIDYLRFENVQVIAGKFLIPFGVFGERLHPTWINKLPTTPILFGHAHGGIAEGSLLPILSDAGFMLRWTASVGESWALNMSGYVTQGPRLSETAEGGDGHLHAAVVQAAASATHSAPPVAFGVAFGDNNQNKMFGGRIGMVKGGGFEVYASGFHSMYDADDYLDYYAGAVSAEWRRGPWEARGEMMQVWQEFKEGTLFSTLERSGFYVQTSYRIRSWEPVVRWGRLLAPRVSGADVDFGHSEVAFGLAYWLNPTLPLKLAYEVHQDIDDSFTIQWAFGF